MMLKPMGATFLLTVWMTVTQAAQPQPAHAVPENIRDLMAESDHAMQKGDLDRALDLALRAEFYLKRLKQDVGGEVFLSLGNRIGNIYIQQGRYDASVEVLQELIDHGLANVFVYHNLGIAYQKKQEYALAIDAYSMALVENPRFVGAIYGLADCRRQIGQYAQAYRLLKDLEKLAPELLDVPYRLAEIAESMKKHRDATVYYALYLERSGQGRYAQRAREGLARMQRFQKQKIFQEISLAAVFLTALVSIVLIFTRMRPEPALH